MAQILAARVLIGVNKQLIKTPMVWTHNLIQ